MIPKRSLGNQGLVVSALGLGCMGMTAFYGSTKSDDENIETIGKALELGINFFDTAWIYQSFGFDGQPNRTNEELLGKAVKKYGREKFIIATKFGITMTETGLGFSGKPELIRAQLNESLERLGVEYIDLYYQHRMDPTTPIEETVQCLKELIEEGKIKYIGLSEVAPDELRRAHAIHPITAIQMEWSLQTRDLESTVIPVARELGVGIVPYSPLGRGLLTGKITSVDSLAPADWRRSVPRFAEENFDQNIKPVVEDFASFAGSKGCTPAQLALAWVLGQGDDTIPIPGTTSATRLAENAGAFAVSLSLDERKQLEAIVPEAVGDRYPGMGGTFNQRL